MGYTARTIEAPDAAPPSESNMYSLIKRLADILLSLFALVVLLPLIGLISFLIWLESGSPALFRQTRVGREGRDFVMLKFRTMRHLRAAQAGLFTPGDVSRVTRIGRWLRASKLDETPQFINVLIGDMSLVGPRPEVREWVDAYPDQWRRVLTVKPGIFDLATIRYRNEEELLGQSADPKETYRNLVLPDKLALHQEYVLRQGFAMDAEILFRGVFAVLSGNRSKAPGLTRNRVSGGD